MNETLQSITTKSFYGKSDRSQQIRSIPSDSEDSILADEDDHIAGYQDLDETLTNFESEDELPLSNFINATSSANSKVHKLVWTENQTSTDNDKVKFCGSTDSPEEILELCTPYTIFNFFFTDEFMKLMIDMTVLYSVQSNPNRPFVTTTDEIQKFIGILP
ncbi:hypothetical protein JTB14_002119 [Gonioctena quinquepunctata]|nr:hypothetical protein JTB14_002119 [Gonioctena quinquepunctata]